MNLNNREVLSVKIHSELFSLLKGNIKYDNVFEKELYTISINEG